MPQTGYCSRFIPGASNEEGVEFAWPQGDQTIIQVDHSSISPDSTHVEAMNLYRYLVLLEKVKKITEYKLSYTDCVRVIRETPGTAGDSFKVTLTEEQKYKCLKDGPTAKALDLQVFLFIIPARSEAEQDCFQCVSMEVRASSRGLKDPETLCPNMCCPEPRGKEACPNLLI